MASRSPTAETIRFIAKILAARHTPLAELSETIAALQDVLTGLGAAPRVAEAPPKLEPSIIPQKPIVIPQKMPRKLPLPRLSSAPRRKAAISPPVEAPVEPVEKRRRGRPRRVVTPLPVVEAEIAAEVPEPVQPRLLRRADVVAHEQDHHHHPDPLPAFKAPKGAVSGVVKWFDGRAGKGALRLTGVSGDVILDQSILTQSGIKRLYKDQEILATLQEGNGKVRILSLALPGRNIAASAGSSGAEGVGTLRRQPRAVMVEIKRDDSRQRAARAEAEQVLGGVGRPKITRRLTP